MSAHSLKRSFANAPRSRGNSPPEKRARPLRPSPPRSRAASDAGPPDNAPTATDQRTINNSARALADQHAGRRGSASYSPLHVQFPDSRSGTPTQVQNAPPAPSMLPKTAATSSGARPDKPAPVIWNSLQLLKRRKQANFNATKSQSEEAASISSLSDQLKPKEAEILLPKEQLNFFLDLHHQITELKSVNTTPVKRIEKLEIQDKNSQKELGNLSGDQKKLILEQHTRPSESKASGERLSLLEKQSKGPVTNSEPVGTPVTRTPSPHPSSTRQLEQQGYDIQKLQRQLNETIEIQQSLSASIGNVIAKVDVIESQTTIPKGPLNESQRLDVLEEFTPTLFTKYVDPLEKTLKWLEEELGRIKQEIAQLQAKRADEASSQLQSLELKIANVEATCNKSIDSMSLAIRGLGEQYNNITAEEIHGKMTRWFLQTYNSNMMARPQEIRTMQRWTNWVKSNAGDLEALLKDPPQLQRLALLETSCTSVTGRLANLESLTSTCRQDIDAVKTDVGTCLQDVDAVKTDVRTCRQDIDAVKTDVGACRQDVDAVKTDVGTCRQDIDAVKTDVGTCRQDIDAVKTDVGTCRQDIDAVKIDVRTCRQDIDAVKTDVGTCRQDIDAVKTDVGACRQDVDAVKTDVGTCQETMLRAGKSIDGIETSLTTLAARFDEFKSLSSALHQKLDTVKTGMETLLGDRHDLQAIKASHESLAGRFDKLEPVVSKDMDAIKTDVETYREPLAMINILVTEFAYLENALRCICENVATKDGGALHFKYGPRFGPSVESNGTN